MRLKRGYGAGPTRSPRVVTVALAAAASLLLTFDGSRAQDTVYVGRGGPQQQVEVNLEALGGSGPLPEPAASAGTTPAGRALRLPPPEPPRSHLTIDGGTGGERQMAEPESRLLQPPQTQPEAAATAEPTEQPQTAERTQPASEPESPAQPEQPAAEPAEQPAAEAGEDAEPEPAEPQTEPTQQAETAPEVPEEPQTEPLEAGPEVPETPEMPEDMAAAEPAEPSEATGGMQAGEAEPDETQMAARTTGEFEQVRVSFASGSAELSDAAQQALGSLAERMKQDEEMRIQLLAFAEGTEDTASRARRLSLSRALAVRSFLIDQGIRSTRMDVRALGSQSEDGPPDRVDIVPAER